MYLGYHERNDILEFNTASDKYRIEVRDYSEYNTETDNSAGLTKLNTELIAGNIPDMMSADTGLPLRQYGSKGILEDLWPFIENDTEIGGRAWRPPSRTASSTRSSPPSTSSPAWARPGRWGTP